MDRGIGKAVSLTLCGALLVLGCGTPLAYAGESPGRSVTEGLHVELDERGKPLRGEQAEKQRADRQSRTQSEPVQPPRPAAVEEDAPGGGRMIVHGRLHDVTTGEGTGATSAEEVQR